MFISRSNTAIVNQRRLARCDIRVRIPARQIVYREVIATCEILTLILHDYIDVIRAVPLTLFGRKLMTDSNSRIMVVLVSLLARSMACRSRSSCIL